MIQGRLPYWRRSPSRICPTVHSACCSTSRAFARGPSPPEISTASGIPCFSARTRAQGFNCNQDEASSVVIKEVSPLQPFTLGTQVVNPTWLLEAISTKGDVLVKSRAFGSAGTDQASLIQPNADRRPGYWIEACTNINEHAVEQFSSLKSKRRDGDIVELLREVDERLTRIDILAPRGKAQLSIELEGVPQMLPPSMMARDSRGRSISQ